MDHGAFELHSHKLILLQEEQKKEGQNDDSHGNPEIDRLRKEVQDTKEINKKLRDLLQVHVLSSWSFSVTEYLTPLCLFV